MRTVTFSNPAVIAAIQERFVVAWKNKSPEVFEGADPTGLGQPAQNPHYFEAFPNGAGGANIQTYFADAGGRILQYLEGYWRPEEFLADIGQAVELAGLDDAGRRARHAALAARARERAAAATDAKAARAHEIRDVLHRTTIERLGRPVEEFFQVATIEEFA